MKVLQFGGRPKRKSSAANGGNGALHPHLSQMLVRMHAVHSLDEVMRRPKWRGAINVNFQLLTTVGILVAGLVNYGAQTR